MDDLAALRHAQDLRDTWQGRALRATKGRPLGAVLMSVLAHNYDEAMPTLLQVVFPGFAGLKPPGLTSCGKIVKTGHVCADIVTADGSREINAILFRDTAHLQSAFRRLADAMKLADDERREMFGAVQRWIVVDYRLDPAMNPADPEAKRLVVH